MITSVAEVVEDQQTYPLPGIKNIWAQMWIFEFEDSSENTAEGKKNRQKLFVAKLYNCWFKGFPFREK